MHNISSAKQDGITKLFLNNDYVGYLDENDDLYVFDPVTKHANLMLNSSNLYNVKTFLKLYFDKQKKQPKTKIEKPLTEEESLIGFLSTKLAIYAPDDPIIKKALDYLERKKK